MSGLCLAAAGFVVALNAGEVTLAWRHSVEKIAWEEDWRLEEGRLVVKEARVRGSGAGMDPPPEAKFERGVWRWKPALPPQKSVTLRRSGATADWRLCIAGRCSEMDMLMPKDADPVVMRGCN
jgi:hypothetical protein